ncbi:MAG: hypothetical protein IPN90_08580 [Elusimicrobia bacterium]|nr:hypothetical protein [Elusimicrobiota bacterium]
MTVPSAVENNQSGFILNRVLMLGIIVLLGWALYKGYLKYRGPSATQVIQKISK